MTRSAAVLAALVLLAFARRAAADENVTSSAPEWKAFRDSIAAGAIDDPLGGVQSIDARVLGVSRELGLTLLVAGASELDRPYSLPQRRREMAGTLSTACEFQEGRPCGDGVGSAIELDASATFWKLTGAIRARDSGGTGNFESTLLLDRAYLKLDAGPFSAQLGRDAFALGPSVRNALAVSRNAAPMDGLRLQLHPVALPFAPSVRVSLFYFLTRLRPPQRFSGSLLDGARMQIDFGKILQIGGTRMLELGGEHAPYFGGLWGFITEHFGREQNSAAENNRLSFDASVRISSAARAYYEIAFEDTRDQLLNSVRWDADHLLGLELHLPGPAHRVFAEFLHTGWVSQEHFIFTSGLTNAGRVIGPVTGPDTTSLWLSTDLEAGRWTFSPWVEFLRYRANRYDSDEITGVFITALGPIEHRQRVGAQVAWAASRQLHATASLYLERIANAALVDGDTRIDAGAQLLVELVR